MAEDDVNAMRGQKRGNLRYDHLTATARITCSYLFRRNSICPTHGSATQETLGERWQRGEIELEGGPLLVGISDLRSDRVHAFGRDFFQRRPPSAVDAPNVNHASRIGVVQMKDDG